MNSKTALVRRKIETKNIFGKKFKFKRNDEVLLLGEREDSFSGYMILVCDKDAIAFIELPENDLMNYTTSDINFTLPPYKHPNLKIDENQYTLVTYQGREHFSIGTIRNSEFPIGGYLLYNNSNPRKPVVSIVDKTAVSVKHEKEMIFIESQSLVS